MNINEKKFIGREQAKGDNSIPVVVIQDMYPWIDDHVGLIDPECRRARYKASLADNPAMWDCGPSVPAAIGGLMLTAGLIGIKHQ